MIVYLIIHVLLIVPCYLICRENAIEDGEWTMGKRLTLLSICILGSPIVVFLILVFYLITIEFWNKKAKW